MRIVNSCMIAVALVSLPGAALASTITSATVYTNTPDPNNAGDLAANTAASLPSARFTIGPLGINFNYNIAQPSSLYTVGNFLNNPVFTSPANGFSPSTVLSTNTTGTEVVITGTVSLSAGSNIFSITHDDGIVFNIPGLGYVLNQSGPSAPTATPFTVMAPTAGEYAFSLDYSECCVGDANLDLTLNGNAINSTPEPSSIALLGTGTLALAGLARRRFRIS